MDMCASYLEQRQDGCLGADFRTLAGYFVPFEMIVILTTPHNYYGHIDHSEGYI